MAEIQRDILFLDKFLASLPWPVIVKGVHLLRHGLRLIHESILYPNDAWKFVYVFGTPIWFSNNWYDFRHVGEIDLLIDRKIIRPNDAVHKHLFKIRQVVTSIIK